MKLTKIINNNQCSLSCEVFPPKKSTSFESVKTAVESIARMHPSFMSVTYGAGGGTSQYTLEIAKDIKYRFNVPTMAHLTCVSSDKATVAERIYDIKQAGIVNVMALRGDLTPELAQSDRSAWDYHHAIDLVRELKESDADFCIGCACYPEVHPESKDQIEDIKYLKEKVDAGCDFITTQMSQKRFSWNARSSSPVPLSLSDSKRWWIDSARMTLRWRRRASRMPQIRSSTCMRTVSKTSTCTP